MYTHRRDSFAAERRLPRRALLTAILLICLSGSYLTGVTPDTTGFRSDSLDSASHLSQAFAAPISPPCIRTATISTTVATVPAVAGQAGSVTVTGTGFLPYEPLTVYNNVTVPFGGTDQGSPAGGVPAQATSSGTLSVQVPVLAGAVRDSYYSLAAVGIGATCATFSGLTEGGAGSGATPYTASLVNTALQPVDNIPMSGAGQTVLISTSRIASTTAYAQLYASIDEATTNNYTNIQSVPVPIAIIPRLDLVPAGSAFGLFQLALPVGLSPNVHSIDVYVSGSLADAVGVRYVQSAPTISVSPAVAPPYARVTVSGSGFAISSSQTNEPITVTLGSLSTGPMIVTGTTSSNTGSFNFPITLPLLNAGTVPVTVTDAAGDIATSSLTINPLSGSNGSSLSLVAVGGNACTPVSGATVSAVPTQTVAVVLNGFGANEPVTLLVQGTPVSTLQTSNTGQATGSMLFPNTVALNGTTPAGNLPGDRGLLGTALSVSAVGTTSGNVATTQIASCPTTASISPAAPNFGQALSFTGSGFAARDVVSLTLYSASLAPAISSPADSVVTHLISTTADNTGNVQAVIPAVSIAGMYVLRAQGLSSGLVATVPFTVTGPTATPTNTSPPTATPTNTETPTVTSSPTVTPTVTSTPIPFTSSPTATPRPRLPTATPTPTSNLVVSLSVQSVDGRAPSADGRAKSVALVAPGSHVVWRILISNPDVATKAALTLHYDPTFIEPLASGTVGGGFALHQKDPHQATYSWKALSVAGGGDIYAFAAQVQPDAICNKTTSLVLDSPGGHHDHTTLQVTCRTIPRVTLRQVGIAIFATGVKSPLSATLPTTGVAVGKGLIALNVTHLTVQLSRSTGRLAPVQVTLAVALAPPAGLSTLGGTTAGRAAGPILSLMAVDFNGQLVNTLDRNLRLTLSLDARSLPASVKLASLAVYRLDVAAHTWRKLATAVDTRHTQLSVDGSQTGLLGIRAPYQKSATH